MGAQGHADADLVGSHDDRVRDNAKYASVFKAADALSMIWLGDNCVVVL
jgi:hypothetical protein